MSSPIKLEWEENGLHVTIDVDELHACVLELDGSRMRGVMRGGDALAFYEHVVDVLTDHYREASAARASVAAGQTVEDFAGRASRVQYAGEDETGGLDITDPDHPGYAANLLELGDMLRKRERES